MLARGMQCRMMPLVQQPVRMIHARGYTNFEDHESWIFNEINFALHAAKNTENIAFVYAKYGEAMTDRQIMYGFNYICMNNLDKNEQFWNDIVPLVKKQLETLDRETCRSFYMAVEGAAGMWLQDDEFWKIVEEKFVDEGLWRYFSLEESARMLCMFARVGRGSDEIIDLLEKHFIKHRKGLTPLTIEIASQGFNKINKGSEILKRVLADPNTELPALE